MDSTLLLQSHVVISLVAILSGLVVLWGLLQARTPGATTLVFLVTTAATSISGFFFHRDHLLPSHIVGIVALVVMLPTLLALYTFRLRGGWRAGVRDRRDRESVVQRVRADRAGVPESARVARTRAERLGTAVRRSRRESVFVIFIALTVLALRRNRRQGHPAGAT